jgi:elongation factor Ts
MTKLTKGQELKGKVKNIIRNGAFIELPEGEEGFLRGGEITEGGENVAVDTLLQIGQEVTVRVLRIERGKVNLTMKAQVDMKSINKSINNNEEGGASNPFEVFFRNANLIGSSESSEDSSAAVEEQPATESSVEATETETPTPVDSEEVSPASDEPAAETAAMVETPAIEEEKSESSATVDTDVTALSDEQVAEELAEAIKDITDLAESAAGTEQ